jgi:tRNA(His) 5'-end guanylyltransferase
MSNSLGAIVQYHQQEISEYLKQRQQQAQQIRLINEQKFDPQGLRDRLLARRAEKLIC